MIGEALKQASIVAIASILMGVVPLVLGIVYAIRPNERRLAMMRPVSLATIFAVLSGSTLGLLNTFRNIGMGQTGSFSRVNALAVSESLVPIFFGFGCLTVAWICVALGLWRRP
jgi:hypothetical protein